MEPLSRPEPPRSLSERARVWIDWFGIGRLMAATAATLVVCAGGYWLISAPPPATEASLPRATTTSDAPIATAPAPTAPVPVVATVHVAGAVVEPGVYELRGDSRVRDAIVAAGGPTDAANWNALNLAAPIVDGSKLYVPVVGEEVPAELIVTPTPATASTSTPIDVNAATAIELESLPGVGPATATAIVTERERSGPFLDVDDLERVPGIGPAKVDALRELVTT